MRLKARISSLDEIEEGLRGLYEEADDGTFVLALDDVDSHPGVRGLKTAYEKEQERRKKAGDELAALREQIGDLDPETARAAQAKLLEMEDKKLLDEGKVEELLKQRTERMAKDHEARVKALNAKLEELSGRESELTGRLQKVLVEGAIREAATKHGVRPTAVTDVLMRGNSLFQLDGEDPLPRDAKGEIVRGKNGVDPMTIDEWFGSLQADAPHLFEASNGSGAAGSQRGQGGTHRRTVSLSDPKAIGANLEEVAAGNVNFTD
jgi:hypothetical protein